MKIIITGATGFIGRSAVIHLAKQGHEITAIVRKAGSVSDLPCKSLIWDSNVETPSVLSPFLKNKDAIVHLAGEPVATSRWTPQKKELIRSSRVDGTQKIVEAIKSLEPEVRPKHFICASAIGYYGHRENGVMTESSSKGSGFLSDVVWEWEAMAERMIRLGVTLTRLRIGVVLGRNGGALEKMLPSVLGQGDQWMSWIHLNDVVRLIQFCLENPKASGAINAVAPEPVQNSTFTQELAQAKHQNLLPPAPTSILKLALGEMAHVILDSTRVIPEKATLLGFKFSYPTLKEALNEIFGHLKRGESQFSAVQFVAKNKAQVFEFFSKAENLETITPPWLNFKVTKMSTPGIQEGTLIDYRLNIHGVPVTWRTRIEEWMPNEKFVDTQLKGPYSKWHHTHRFEEIPGGTLMWDDVIYKLPAGKLGNFFGQALVRKDVRTIFDFRKKKILELFHHD